MGEPTIRIGGDDSRVVERLRAALVRALEHRGRDYDVHVGVTGCVGELRVRVAGAKGHVVLTFDSATEPGYVTRVVRETVERFEL